MVKERSDEAVQVEEEKKNKVVPRRAWDCGSPLYDSFELASVYGLLDSNLMALPFAKRSAALDTAAECAPARRNTKAKEKRRRKAAAAAARRRGKAVLRSIFRSVTYSRRL